MTSCVSSRPIGAKFAQPHYQFTRSRCNLCMIRRHGFLYPANCLVPISDNGTCVISCVYSCTQLIKSPVVYSVPRFLTFSYTQSNRAIVLTIHLTGSQWLRHTFTRGSDAHTGAGDKSALWAHCAFLLRGEHRRSGQFPAIHERPGPLPSTAGQQTEQTE